MSHGLGRVVSDLSISRSARTDHSLHHQSTTTTSSNVGKAKHKLSLLFSGVVAWTGSESSGEEAGSSRPEKNSSRKQQTKDRAGGRRRGMEIVLSVRKYVAMVEQLFTSYSRSSSLAVDRRDVRRPHTFTSGRGAAQSSKRHRGRMSSAPASLRGLPAASGHLSVGESVTTKAASTSSEVSTMEELQSAVQAAIAHCKNSVAGGGDRQQQQERKC